MLGVLTHPDVDLVVVNDGGRQDVVAGPAPAQYPVCILGVAVELPDQLTGLGVERIDPAIAAREDDLASPVDHGIRRIRPAPVKQLLANDRAFPDQLSRILVQRDEVRRKRRRDVHVSFVDAVAGHGIEEVTDDQWRSRRQVVGKDVELGDHVIRPDDIAVDRFGSLLVRDGTVVLAVAEAVRVQAGDGRPVRHVVESVAFDVRGRADALQGPVVDPPRAELFVRHLPQKLTAVGIERHHHAEIVLEPRIPPPLVVRPDEDFPAGDDRSAVRLRADFRGPLDVLTALDIPARRQAGLVRDHVAGRRIAEHRSFLRLCTGDHGDHDARHGTRDR